jgi:hypothetical protein
LHVSRVSKCVEEGRGWGGENSGTREESLGRTAEAGKEAEIGRGGEGEGRRVVKRKCRHVQERRRHEQPRQVHGPADTCASK